MTTELTKRRALGGLIRLGLIVLAVVVAVSWLASKRSGRDRGTMPSAIVRGGSGAMGPGDVQITSTERDLTLTLRGDRILTGLSPERVAEIRAKIQQSAAKDTSGLGGSIAQMVKKTVADNIDAQFAFAVADIRDVTFEDGHLVLHMEDGKTNRLFENTRVDNRPQQFARDDAERFIAAFRERKKTLP